MLLSHFHLQPFNLFGLSQLRLALSYTQEEEAAHAEESARCAGRLGFASSRRPVRVDLAHIVHATFQTVELALLRCLTRGIGRAKVTCVVFTFLDQRLEYGLDTLDFVLELVDVRSNHSHFSCESGR